MVKVVEYAVMSLGVVGLDSDINTCLSCHQESDDAPHSPENVTILVQDTMIPIYQLCIRKNLSAFINPDVGI